MIVFENLNEHSVPLQMSVSKDVVSEIFFFSFALQFYVLFQGDSTVVGTSKLRDLYDHFEEELGSRQERAKSSRPKWEPPKTKLDLDQGKVSSQVS